MKLPSGSFFVFALAAALASSSAQTFAQGAQPTAGGGRAKAPSRQTLDLTLSSTAGYDPNSDPDGRVPIVSAGQDSAGYSTMLVTTAEYGYRGRRVQARANEASAVRYFRPLGNLFPASFDSVNHSAALGLTVRSRRTTFDLNQTGVYTSSPLYSLLPHADAAVAAEALTIAPDYGYALNNLDVYSYNTATTLTRQMTARTALSGSVDWQHTDARSLASGRRGLNMYRARGQVMHRIWRNTSARGGYFYRLGDVDYAGAVVTLVENGIETGIDYRRPFSATRALTFGAGAGVSSVVLPALPDGIRQTDRRYNAVSGQLSFGYEFARRWVARAAYQQGVDYLTGLSEPITSRTASTSVEGALGRRVSVALSASYVTGAAALTPASSAFDTYSGDLRLRYAVTRTLMAYVERLYYFYDFGGTRPLLPGIPPSLQRQGLRVGLALRVPAL